MPSIWIREEDKATLMRIRACLQKMSPGRNIGMPETVSKVLESTTIPALPPEKDEEIIKRLRILLPKATTKGVRM